MRFHIFSYFSAILLKHFCYKKRNKTFVLFDCKKLNVLTGSQLNYTSLSVLLDNWLLIDGWNSQIMLWRNRMKGLKGCQYLTEATVLSSVDCISELCPSKQWETDVLYVFDGNLFEEPFVMTFGHRTRCANCAHIALNRTYIHK